MAVKNGKAGYTMLCPGCGIQLAWTGGPFPELEEQYCADCAHDEARCPRCKGIFDKYKFTDNPLCDECSCASADYGPDWV